jgi:hypothetical protein
MTAGSLLSVAVHAAGADGGRQQQGPSPTAAAAVCLHVAAAAHVTNGRQAACTRHDFSVDEKRRLIQRYHRPFRTFCSVAFRPFWLLVFCPFHQKVEFWQFLALTLDKGRLWRKIFALFIVVIAISVFDFLVSGDPFFDNESPKYISLFLLLADSKAVAEGLESTFWPPPQPNPTLRTLYWKLIIACFLGHALKLMTHVVTSIVSVTCVSHCVTICDTLWHCARTPKSKDKSRQNPNFHKRTVLATFTSMTELTTFETVNQFDQACLIWGQESDLSNIFIIIYTENHQTRKKVKNGQKLPKTAEILYVFFNVCSGPLECQRS